MALVIPPSARVAARTQPCMVLVVGSVATCSNTRQDAHAHDDKRPEWIQLKEI